MSTTTNYPNATETIDGDIFKDIQVLAITTATVGLALLIILFLICRCCCGQRKSSQAKIYENREDTENQVNNDNHEYLELTDMLPEDIKEKPDETGVEGSRSLANLDLDLDPDPNNYLSPRPSGYFDKLPPPPASWIIPEPRKTETTTGTGTKPEVSAVDTNSEGISVTIKRGKMQRIIDIKFT